MEYQVIILRGTSGSGKSTYTKKHFPDAFVCSADNFFIQKDGSYRFQRELLGRAHTTCYENFEKALRLKAPQIVVDNTNCTKKEYMKYVQGARKYGYDVLFVRLQTPVEVAAARNTHSVPLHAVQGMASRMDEVPEGYEEIIVSGTD